MVLPGEPPPGGLDGRRAGASRHAENVMGIAFGHVASLAAESLVEDQRKDETQPKDDADDRADHDDERAAPRRSAGVGLAGAVEGHGADRDRFAANRTNQPHTSRMRLIPVDEVGTITYTQRDVPVRLGITASARLGVAPTMGYIGGPGFPEEPTDLGPIVAMPGGWRELFEYLASVGFRQVEFAGYEQHPDNDGGTASYEATPEGRAAYLDHARRLRGFLDEFGLRAIGSLGFIPETWPGADSPGGGMSAADRLRYMTELEFASILGTPYMGTGNDPTSAENRNVETWTLAGGKWEALNELSINSFAIQLYPHNHSPAYDFVQDGPMVMVTQDLVSGAAISPTQVRGESGKRLMQHFLDVTNPALCVLEMDIFWAYVAQHQWRWRYDWEGNRVEDVFDPRAQVETQPERYVLYHAKDGARTADPPGVGQGYEFVPFGHPRSDIDFRPFLRDHAAMANPHPNYEQDDAPGGSADPGRSLRLSRFSAFQMTKLRD
jgi:sugar phosphate isomerase/epimerase